MHEGVFFYSNTLLNVSVHNLVQVTQIFPDSNLILKTSLLLWVISNVAYRNVYSGILHLYNYGAYVQLYISSILYTI